MENHILENSIENIIDHLSNLVEDEISRRGYLKITYFVIVSTYFLYVSFKSTD